MGLDGVGRHGHGGKKRTLLLSHPIVPVSLIVVPVLYPRNSSVEEA